jgi:hypothetical protein
MKPKFPHVVVNLTENDGNAFFIMGRVTQALRRAGVPKEDIDSYTDQATSGDYDHLLQVTMATVAWE